MQGRNRRWGRASIAALAVGVVAIGVGGLATGAIKEKSKSFVVPTGGDPVEETVKCKRKQEAISGGYLGSEFNEAAIRDFARSGKRKWRYVLNDVVGGIDGQATAYVYCAKPKLGLRATAKTETIDGPLGTITATCPRVREAVSGGFDTPDGFEPLIVASKRAGARGWTVAWAIEGSDSFEATAIAYCDKRDTGLKEMTATETVPVGDDASVTARCGRKQRVISGGFEGEYNLDDFQIASPKGSRRDGRRKWIATADGTAGTSDPELTAYAYCAKKEKKS